MREDQATPNVEAASIGQAFLAWRHDQRIRWDEVAGLLGCSRDVLHKVCCGTYRGDSAFWLEKVRAFLATNPARESLGLPPRSQKWRAYVANREALPEALRHPKAVEVKRPERVEFIRTSVFLDTVGALALARDKRQLAVIVGPPGCGKTLAATSFAANEPNAILVTPPPQTRNIMRLLAERLGIAWRSAEQSGPRVVEEVRRGGCFIIIDEAENLGPGAQALRWLHDQADCGVVLLGGLNLVYRVGSSEDGGSLEFADRASVVRLGGIDAEDAQALGRFHGIDESAALEGYRLSHGSARRLVAAFARAKELANGGRVTSEHIEAAFE